MKRIILYLLLLLPAFGYGQVGGDTLLVKKIDSVTVVRKRSSQVVITSSEQLRSVPTLLGEMDIVKYATTLPGVAATNALDPNFYVRGGAGDENRSLVDGFPIANPQHLTGILSLYDSYILNSSSLYKSGYPARYSGALSSYLNMFANHERDSLWHGEATLGLVSSSVKSTIPVGSGDGVLALSFRSSYMKLFTEMANALFSDVTVIPYQFCDVTASYSQSLANDWQVKSFALYAYDNMVYEANSNLYLEWSSYSYNTRAYKQYENSTLALKAGLWGKDIECTYYDFSEDAKFMDDINFRLDAEYSYSYGDGASLSVGLFEEFTQMENNMNNESYRNFLTTLWLSDRHTFGDFTIESGLSLEYYSGDADALSLSPRLKVNYGAGEWMLWADYSRTAQYTTSYTMLTLPSAVDMVFPLEEGDKPAFANQFSVGAERSWASGLSIYGSLFYRRYANVKEVTGVSLAQNIFNLSNPEQIIGVGAAKGVEMEFSYSLSKLHLRGNYTLSDSWRQFDELNDGERFKPPYDITHNVLLSMQYELSDKISVNGAWVYNSGTYITYPVGVGVAYNIHTGYAMVIPVYDDVYNYRLPSTHRLDLSVSYQTSKGFTTSLGVYNAYNQNNISLIGFRINEVDDYTVQIVPTGYVLLPIIPYLSISYKW